MIVLQGLDDENGGVDGYTIVNMYGDWFVMMGNNLNGRLTEEDTMPPIPIVDGLIDVVKYLVRVPGAHLHSIYDVDAGELQMVTVLGFCEANWTKIDGRFGGFLQDPPVVSEDLRLTLRMIRGVTVGAYTVDAKPCMRYWKFTRAAGGFRRVDMRRDHIEPDDIHMRGEMAVKYEMIEERPTVVVRPGYLR